MPRMPEPKTPDEALADLRKEWKQVQADPNRDPHELRSIEQLARLVEAFRPSGGR